MRVFDLPELWLVDGSCKESQRMWRKDKEGDKGAHPGRVGEGFSSPRGVIEDLGRIEAVTVHSSQVGDFGSGESEKLAADAVGAVWCFSSCDENRGGTKNMTRTPNHVRK